MSLARSWICRLDTDWPKYWLAMSGSWCASSKINTSASGINSPNPVSLIAKSAKNKWWFTTTTSNPSLFYALSVRSNRYNGHSLPKQLSLVEVIVGITGLSSAISSQSPKSPVCVDDDQLELWLTERAALDPYEYHDFRSFGGSALSKHK